jgi:hypothetical protein
MQWYAQELYDQKVSGVINLVKDQMKSLQKTKRDKSKKTISSGINYDILNIRRYQAAF